MKKIVASVGLVAIGASGIQTASAQALGAPDASKPWSVSATLRGFYDDNVATIPNNVTLPAGTKRDSFGFEVSPSAALAWSVEQTTVTLGAMYSFLHYDNIPLNSTGHNDNTFTFSGTLTHAFNEQVSAKVSDSFVIGQEPDLLRAGNVFSTFQRVSGNNIRNYGMLGLDAQLTPVFGLGFGYDNAFYDYKDRGPGLSGGIIQPSLAGALNRDENRVHIEGTWNAMPETKGLLGFQFTDFNYNANELIGGSLDPVIPGQVDNPVFSKARDSREYTGYLGAEHNFSPQFKGAIRIGGSYTEYPNDSSAKSTYTPYVNMTLKYNYSALSYVEGGFSYDRNATDLVGTSKPGTAGATTLDAESAVVFASVNHAITPQLLASLIGQFQNSSYHGGTFNSSDEQFYLLGLNLAYRFNQYFAANIGYDYDNLRSSAVLNRSFDRNRVYIGLTATY